MCSHYQTLKDAELLLKKFGVREKPAAIGKYDLRLPCVIERDQDVQDLIEAPDKLRKCMEPP